MDGSYIKKRRKELGMTQLKLAKLIGVSENTILNYEKGKTIPSSKTSILRDVLKEIPREELVEGDNNIGYVNEPREVYKNEKAEFEVILDHLSVDEIVTYIFKYEKERFADNDTYQQLIRIHKQDAIIEYLKNELK